MPKNKTLRKKLIRGGRKTLKMKGGKSLADHVLSFMGLNNNSNPNNPSEIQSFSSTELNKIKNTNFKIKLDPSLISTPKSSILSLPNCKDSLLEMQTALKSKISLLNLELKYYQSLQSKFKDFLNSDFSKSWAVYENELNLSNQNKINLKLAQEINKMFESSKDKITSCTQKLNEIQKDNVEKSKTLSPINLTNLQPKAKPVAVQSPILSKPNPIQSSEVSKSISPKIQDNMQSSLKQPVNPLSGGKFKKSRKSKFNKSK